MTEVDPLEVWRADTLGVPVRVETELVWPMESAVFDEMPTVVGTVVWVGPGRLEDMPVLKEFCALMELDGITIELIWRGIDLRIKTRVVVSMSALVTPWMSMCVVTSSV